MSGDKTWTQEMFDLHDESCPFGGACTCRGAHALNQEAARGHAQDDS